MRFNTLFYGTFLLSLVALFVHSAPLYYGREDDLSIRAKLKGLGGLGKTSPKTPKPAAPAPPPPPPPKPAAPPPPPAPKPAAPKPADPAPADPKPKVSAPAPPKQVKSPAAAPPAKPSAKNTPSAAPSKDAKASSAAAKPSSATKTSSAPAESSSAADSCPLYTAPDAADLSARNIENIERRAKEEYWFRFDDPSVATGGPILQLASRSGTKDFDDQAYKWISTDAKKVTRGKPPGRIATVYVLPAGTRDSVLSKAVDFNKSQDEKKRQDFVTKDNEPGDVGIQGVSAAQGAKTLPLDDFRNKVIRTVSKQTGKGGKATFSTVTKGKVSKTASKDDQAALAKFC